MTIKATLQRTLTTAIITLLLSSCIGDTIQHQYHHISKEGWSRNDTIAFELPPANVEGHYAVDTEIRTTRPFPYQKIWVVREVLFQTPLMTHNDTICIETGSDTAFPEGKGVTIRTYSHSDTTFALKEGQQGRMKLYHVMSREILPHITDIGINMRAIR